VRPADGIRRPAGALPILPDRSIADGSSAPLDILKRFVEGCIDAAVLLDSDRRLVHYNRGYEEASGHNRRALNAAIQRGARCFEILPLGVCEQACVGCRARDTGRPIRVDEVPAIRRDGEYRNFIVAATAFGDHIIEMYRDVTGDARVQRRFKSLLDAERRHKQDLEEVVAQRTEELQTAQAKLVLQEKMSSLGRLVAGVAHELNNPINFVYGNVDFVGQYMDDLIDLIQQVDALELPAEARATFEAGKQKIDFAYLVGDSKKLINSIRSGAERTAAIVRDLRGFSRTPGGEMLETDVVAGIETTLNLISPLHRGRITIERDYGNDLPRLVCNAGRINQVFMNILTNAAQAIKGPGRIRIGIHSINQDGRDLLRVEVTDSGPGIAPELIQKIRDPFFTTKDVGEGTGLGLWICENIVRSHGGTLTCESQVGVGSTFTVTLPLRQPEKPAAAPTDSNPAENRSNGNDA
jgi:signal transduction histidine kinase